MNDSSDYQAEIPRKPGKYCCPKCSKSKADKPLSVHYDGSELYYKCHRCDYKGRLSDGRDNGQPIEAAITVDSLAEYCGLPAKFLREEVGARDGRDWVEFPYRNADGSTFRIKKRLRLHKQKDKPRFVWDEQKDRGQILYGLERLGRGREAGYSFLAEGESDSWILWFNDLPAIGVSGSQAFKDSRDARYFNDISKIYLIDERDDGGKELTAKLAASTIRDKVYRVSFEKFGVKDVRDLYRLDPAQFLGRLEECRREAPPIRTAAATDSEGSPRLVFRTPRQICEATSETIPWIWELYIAAGCITEISGAAKRSGKTTLQLALVCAILSGKPFLGLPTRQTNIVYLSEEGTTTFGKALRKAGLENTDEGISILQWKDTGGNSWFEIIQAAFRECQRISAGLLIIDTLPQFAQQASDSEKSDGAAREILSPLLAAASDGRAILIDRHQRKGGGIVGEGARGSSQFTHGVDVIISLSHPKDKKLGPNVRVIEALSRFDETPETFLIELTDSGYVPVDTTGQSDTTRQQAEKKILEILPSNEGDAMSIAQMYKELQSVRRTLLYQSLETLIRDGAVLRVGAGRRGDPYRHFKPPPDGEKEITYRDCEHDCDSSARNRPPHTYTSRTNRFDTSIRRDSSEASADELLQQSLGFTEALDDSSVYHSSAGRNLSEKSSKGACNEITNTQKQTGVCDACGCKTIVDGLCFACGASLPGHRQLK